MFSKPASNKNSDFDFSFGGDLFMPEVFKKQLIHKLNSLSHQMTLNEVYEMIYMKMQSCRMFDDIQIQSISVKDKDQLVTRFIKANPDIMLACVHWKAEN